MIEVVAEPVVVREEEPLETALLTPIEALPAVLRMLPQREAGPQPPASQNFREATQVVLVVGTRKFPLSLPCLLGRRGTIASDAFEEDKTVSR